MTDQSILSTKQLIVGIVLAMIIGAALTFFVILPAETGEDPSGFGETTGLTDLSAAEAEGSATVVNIDTNALYISIDPETTEVPMDDFGRPAPSLDGENVRLHDSPYKTETVEFVLGADAETEYKAVMDEGEVLLYAWASTGEMYVDFHAHDETRNETMFTRYAEMQEGTSDQGSIVAPYSGQHGWYWLNLTGEDQTITLTVAGYYDELLEIDLSAEY